MAAGQLPKIMMVVKTIWQIWLERNTKTYTNQHKSILFKVAIEAAKELLALSTTMAKSDREKVRLEAAHAELQTIFPKQAAEAAMDQKTDHHPVSTEQIEPNEIRPVSSKSACLVVRFTSMTPQGLAITDRSSTPDKQISPKRQEPKSFTDDAAPEEVPYEIAIVCVLPKPLDIKSTEYNPQLTNAIEYLRAELQSKGLVVELVDGVLTEVFLKIGAPSEVIGRAAEKLQLRKPTEIGLEVVFDWERRHSFIRQPDNSLFSWTERYHCMNFIIQWLTSSAEKPLKFQRPDQSGEFEILPGELLLPKFKEAGVVKELFPLHDDTKREALLQKWPYKWYHLWSQPIDDVYAYFGPKVAIYFAFLGMYTKWLMYPAIMGAFLWFRRLGRFAAVVPILFSTSVILWAVLFLQFWKRENASLLSRWGLVIEDADERVIKAASGSKPTGGFTTEAEVDKMEKEEWMSRLRSIRNNGLVFVVVVCLQLPFELAYAHLNKIAPYDAVRYVLTGLYLFIMQYATKFGGQAAHSLVKTQKYRTKDAEANGLIFKVFGIYFMQSYIGLFYHALFHRDFFVLRQLLIQRLIVSQLMNNFTENLLPYLNYRYAKFKAIREDNQIKKAAGEKAVKYHASRIEKQKMKPTYESSIPSDLEDGLFDDYLELAVQFGMVAMFACALPLVATFAFVNNLMEIRSDSFKLLAMMRRPVPRAASSVGAWLTIFQHLGVVAIVTNCALLVCLYDEVGNWSVEPGLGLILVLEHVLLLMKVGFSWFVPEEPAWVRAKRLRRIQLQGLVSKQLLSLLEKTRND
ncbi:hypothetical protein R1sor_006748 [Riccia sorocarpa]|uniref:Anoctamin transmembrane domain-containing protein n=1 Tax=Riccia sorocarpa TaxID=122646 RepID=A0ABD3HRB7_9MARC